MFLGMNALHPLQTVAALALALLSLPGHAADEHFASRPNIPDAVLRNVTYVACAIFDEGTEHAVPVYTRKGDGFQRAGVLSRAQAVPLSRLDEGAAQEYCFPASETAEVVEAEGPTLYAHAVVDVYTGKKAWLRQGGDGPGHSWVTLQNLGSLGAFHEMGIEFHALRRDSQPLVLREEPRDDSGAVDEELPADVTLGQRVGAFVEVRVHDAELSGPRRLGWLRVEDPSGLLLLWPVHPPEPEGC
ncbi:MAG TPA: hypothetical protein VE153_05910 [Myxococcus sp.]|nr:hypothetical protein [Myxococcus sp.]